MSHGLFELTYAAAPDRYERIPYRRTGNSGLDLPAFSFGLWQKFGTDYAFATPREIILTASRKRLRQSWIRGYPGGRGRRMLVCGGPAQLSECSAPVRRARLPGGRRRRSRPGRVR